MDRKLVLKIQNLSELNEDLNETTVREEIINPLINALGYSSIKKNVMREYRLKKPDIVIGSKREKNNYMPDYLMVAKNKEKWILEAKSMKCNIDEDKYFDQAFSYAINKEINATYFAICNGKKFSLYSVNKREKIFSFLLKELEKYEMYLNDFLSYETYGINEGILKDFGLYLKKEGYTEKDKFTFDLSVRLIDIIDSGTIKIQTPVRFEKKDFFATFLTDSNLFSSAHPFFKYTMELVRIRNKYPTAVPLYDNKLNITFICTLSDKIKEAPKEFYIELEIIEFINVELIVP